jgi:hypothetical protein
VAEEFVRAVNQVNIHEEAMLYEAAAVVLATGHSGVNDFSRVKNGCCAASRDYAAKKCRDGG